MLSSRCMIQILFAIMLFSNVGAGTSFAQSLSKESLEQIIRTKLDRIFLADQYLVDLNLSQAISLSANADDLLPGLEMLGPVFGSTDSQGQTLDREQALKGDILLLVDKTISREKLRVAEQIVKRIVEGEGLKSSVRVSAKQQDLRKIEPLPQQPPIPKPEPGIFEQIERNKELLAKIAIAFWAAILSLMVAFVLMKRIHWSQ